MEKLRVVLLLAVLFFFLLACVVEVGEGKKRGVSIPDELDDVVDDEEDEAWKDWGRKKTVAEDEEFWPLPDFSKMDPAAIQAEMAKPRQSAGPIVGFVKLRLGVPRTEEEVPMIAVRWSEVLRTGGVEVNFMAVDLSTVMFTMERGRDVEELKEFVLDQDEAYEVQIGEQLFRRPGDPPLDQVVVEMLRRREKASTSQ